MSMYCTKCGRENSDEAKFCGKCGTPLTIKIPPIDSLDYATNDGKGLSIAGLVLGIVATVLLWVPVFNIIILVLGIVGIICAVKGRQKQRAAGVTTGIGTAGLVLSIVGTSLAGIGVLTCTIPALCTGGIALCGSGSLLEELQREIQSMY